MNLKKETRKASLKSILYLSIAASIGMISGSALHAEENDLQETIWWVAADPHVGTGGESSPGEYLALAVADMNELGIADYAVMLGDLVSDDYAYTVPFIREMNQLNVGWTYVLGNHDFKRDVNEPVLPVQFSARTVKGIRFVFLSDEVTGAQNRDLVMSEEQESWFWEELDTHKDKPVFLFTHQPHPEVQVWPKLKERLDDYNIVAWFSGHKHRWDIREDSGHGFAMININCIQRRNSESTFLRLQRKAGSVEATVIFRDHENQEWIKVDGQEQFTFSVNLQQ